MAVPYTFVNGQVIKAAEINANFAAVGVGALVNQALSGVINGSNNVFSLPVTPLIPGALITYNGQILDPATQYSLVGITVTLTFAPVSGDVLNGVFLS